MSQATIFRVAVWSSAILVLSLLPAPAPASAAAPVASLGSAAGFSVSTEADSAEASLADLTVALTVPGTELPVEGEQLALADVTDPAGNVTGPNAAVTLEATRTVPLGLAGPYSVLGGSVSSAGETALTGELGVSPAGAITGAPITSAGVHVNDESAGLANAAVTLAYADAAARPTLHSIAGDLAATTLTAGVYHAAAAISLSGTLTLDGRGDPTSVFIIQVGAALSTAASSQIALVNGAQASNVFWQVLGAVSLGANSLFSGTIVALGAIAIGANATVRGRALSPTGAIALNANRVRFTNTAAPIVVISPGALGYTNLTTPIISGTTSAAAGSMVRVTIDGATQQTSVQAGGTWTVTAPTLAVGPHNVVVTITDEFAVVGTATQSLIADRTAPVVTITPGSTNRATTARPRTSGTTDATPGTFVTVKIADQILTTTVQSGGLWSVLAATLVDGTHQVLAQITDLAGNTGAATQALTVDSKTYPVPLGAAASFSVLTGTAVTSTGVTTLSGDLGVGPGGLIVGFPPGIVTGATHAGDPQAALAVPDLLVAYQDAAGRTATGAFAGDQNGRTFTAGVYHTAAAFALTGALTLDAQNDPSAVFIFQVDAALNTAAASQIKLINGAQASNVFWQVLGAAGTGANSSFVGTILALGAITVGAGAVVDGRVLSYAATITLAANTFTLTDNAGLLTISVPTGAGNLGTRANVVGGGTISGQLGSVKVTDSRTLSTVGWVASVTATALVAQPGQSIPASAISYAAGTIGRDGRATYTANAGGNLTDASPAVTASGVVGYNRASWDPTITVAVPSGSSAGVYSFTITHSVL
ncbi:ice-binding family protein [Cryobacterium suzukii]|nr:ice-binding family protein [Cryobacterium suzukii]